MQSDSIAIRASISALRLFATAGLSTSDATHRNLCKHVESLLRDEPADRAASFFLAEVVTPAVRSLAVEGYLIEAAQLLETVAGIECPHAKQPLGKSQTVAAGLNAIRSDLGSYANL